jgi:hypothetical protein
MRTSPQRIILLGTILVALSLALVFLFLATDNFDQTETALLAALSFMLGVPLIVHGAMVQSRRKSDTNS